MGLIQNKVTVSQPNSHVVVKNAGGLRGLTGEQGIPGPQGVPGEAATVTAGTTTTLPAGSNATVQNVGSTSAAIFNFGIPKGDKGDTGETGAAATISVGTTTTLEPGEDATVTNSGTSSAAVFDFGIPKGAKGDTGSQGPAGADGFSPTATVTKTGDTATITITDKDGTTTAQISDGVTPTIDPALSPTSENPVQNKVVANALAGKADKPIVVSSLPATGTAGQEYFVDDRYNTVTELKGDTEQTTYSGKNKAKYNATYSANGIDSVLNSDGSLTCSGTTTTTYFNTLPYQATLPSMLPAGTYTFSRGGDTTYAVQIQLWDSTKNQTLTFRIPAGQTKITDTTTFDAYYYGSSFVYLSANMQINTTVKLQLESGSTATSFEPYVGGTASPNPDYPQEVQTVTGEQTVTVASKNLFNKAAIASGKIVSRGDGTLADNVSYGATEYIPVVAGQQYRFTAGFNYWYTAAYDKDKKYVSNVDNAQTITIPAGASYIRSSVYLSQLDDAQFEKGSTSTPYEPYQGGSYPINLGKNLFDKDNANVVHKAPASSGNSLSTSSYYYSVYLPAIEGATYTFSDSSSSLDQYAKFFFLSEDPTTATTFLTQQTRQSGSQSVTATAPSGAKYLCVYLAYTVTQSVIDDLLASLQIEKGSTATTYAPYFTPIELCKISTYQDYIYKSGEDWYLHKETAKVTLNGSETWDLFTANVFYLNMLSMDMPIDSYVVSYSENYKGVEGFVSANDFLQRANNLGLKYAIDVHRTAKFVRIKDADCDTALQLSTKLSTNNTSLYYAIATPTDTQITNADLIAQLEALAGAKIMVDSGTATVTSQYLPATLTTAYNSNSGYIDYIYDGTNFVKVR